MPALWESSFEAIAAAILRGECTVEEARARIDSVLAEAMAVSAEAQAEAESRSRVQRCGNCGGRNTKTSKCQNVKSKRLGDLVNPFEHCDDWTTAKSSN